MKSNIKDLQLSNKQIERIASRARSGDTAALDELRKINQRLVNNTVRRLKQLDQAEVDSPSADRLRGELEREGRHLSKSKKLDVDQLMEQIRETRAFLRNKTSSVKGAREYTNNYRQSMLENFNVDLSDKETRLKWRDFTRSELFREMVEFDSERTILEGFEAINSGIDPDEIEELWKQYKEKKRSLLQTWSDWTKIE